MCEKAPALQEELAALQGQYATLLDQHHEALNQITSLEAQVAAADLKVREMGGALMQSHQRYHALRRKAEQRVVFYRRQMDALYEEMTAQLNYARSRIAGLEIRLGLNKGVGHEEEQGRLVPRNMPRI